MPSNYHKILGIPENASLEEIKKAYRRKAKELHPDRNKHEEAHEQFILLAEAYEYLINFRTGKIKTKTKASYENWHTSSREEARQRAREHARMKYEEYQKTDFYKNSKAVFVIWDHFYLLSSLLILIGAPAYGYYTRGGAGLAVGIVLVILTAHYWSGIFRERHEVNLHSLWESMVLIGKTKAFHFIIVTLMNIYILFRFTLNSEVDIHTILLSGALLIIAGYFASGYIIGHYKFITKEFLLICIVPYIFNLFFLFNFIFSSSPSLESYSFKRPDNTGYIYLENDEYDNNPWFRTFFDYESMKRSDRVTYTFEEGLFGIRVLRSYTFNQEEYR